MDITEYAKQSQLSRKILRWMVNKEVIHNPLRQGDISNLKFLEKVWAKQEFIRGQLSKYSKARRLRLLENSAFETKWERYAYGRFCNLDKGKRLSMKQLASEIESTFGFTPGYHEIRNLYKVREKAYNKRKAISKKQHESELRN
ncbi:hypothetical protein [Desulfogranum marinum]|uniref:hypothetical protein n=1 Tax=Desulfogranum marinum TaxID=453220 RepID=UPI001965E5A2|nr:hypothetical protein [Desulfogranum marinum]MBM9514058.1 hypothetical protein [Desulfogranum marinum]